MPIPERITLYPKPHGGQGQPASSRSRPSRRLEAVPDAIKTNTVDHQRSIGIADWRRPARTTSETITHAVTAFVRGLIRARATNRLAQPITLAMVASARAIRCIADPVISRRRRARGEAE